jgi:hypothetical protein
MKALKSKLASELLADPAASDQFRQFLVNKPASTATQRQGATGRFVVRGKNGVIQVLATVVPKAAKAA